jgi:hypothetical protein
MVRESGHEYQLDEALPATVQYIMKEPNDTSRRAVLHVYEAARSDLNSSAPIAVGEVKVDFDAREPQP